MRLFSPKWATAILFLLDGMGFGVWAAHVPVIQRNLQLDTASLSLVLLSLVAGAIVSMPLTGYLTARMGSRAVVRVATPAYVATLAVLAMLNLRWAFMMGAALFGAAKGSLDVSLNAHAMAVEAHDGKSCMSLCQGCWSSGGLIGAGATSILLGHRGTVRLDLLLGAAFLAALYLAASPWLVRDPAASHEDSTFVWPDANLLRLALLAFFGLFAEGAVGDWAAVYLHSNVGASLAWAAAGYAAYAVTMAASRFAGGWIAERVSDAKLLFASGLLMATGFAMLLIAHSWPIGFVGLAFTGMGIANVIPVVMNATGRNGRMATGPAISTVSTIGYFGFLSGPPLIGWTAHVIGLQAALMLVVCAGLIVAAGPRFTSLDGANVR